VPHHHLQHTGSHALDRQAKKKLKPILLFLRMPMKRKATTAMPHQLPMLPTLPTIKPKKLLLSQLLLLRQSAKSRLSYQPMAMPHPLLQPARPRNILPLITQLLMLT